MRKLSLCLLLMIAACAHAPSEPVIDMQGVDYTKYQQDLNECRGYAEQVDAANSAATGGAVGAIGGAAIGALFGAVFHMPAAGAVLGAGAGGIGGASGGLAGSMQRKNTIMFKCLAGRGYRVLG